MFLIQINRYKIFAVLFFSFVLSINAYSQASEDIDALAPVEFLPKLEEFMTSSKRKVLEDSFKAFKSFYTSGLEEDEQILVKRVINQMFELKLTASPYFLNYLNALPPAKSHKEGLMFIDWNSIVLDMIKGIENRKLNPLKDFLNFSPQFFSDKKLKHSESGINWAFSEGAYSFSLEDNKPIIKFEDTNIYGIRKVDSIAILETSGTFNPIEKSWSGTGGKVFWRSDGMEKVHVKLEDYSFDATKALYNAEDAMFYNEELFPGQGIPGTFSDKVSAQNLAKGGSYPRFVSNNNAMEINNFGDNIYYKGNFAIHGETIYGEGQKDVPALIEISHKQNKAVKAFAQKFIIKKDEKIVAEQTRVTLNMGQDSIFHPSVNFTYKVPEKIASVYRGDRATDQNPFTNSYHNFNIDAPSVEWLIDKDSIIFGKERPGFAGSIKKKVLFESPKFYNEQEFFKIQNVASSNPLATIKILADRDGVRYMDAEYLAQQLNPKYSVENIQSLLYDLVAQGFIDYDVEKREVFLRDKVFHFVDSAAGKKDYDVLKVTSETDSTNAILDLRTKSLEVNAVEKLEFSTVQKVAIKPFLGKVHLHKDRNVLFDGRIFAGYSILTGVDFTFDYNKFHIKTDSVRYFDLFVPTGAEDEKGNKEALSIGSRIEHANGFLLIDAPNNKSGKEQIENFPSFQSKGYSYVYYDDKDIKEGVYKRDSFYFRLDKFSFNNLDNYVAADVTFKGTMFSADIMPEFEETIVIQEEDQSLGFVRNTPDKGFPAYTGKGKYTGQLWLSNNGFLGKGTVNYLNASIDSEDIVFKPKQMLCSAEVIDLEEVKNDELEIPQVHGEDVTINWKPYQDSLYVNAESEPFLFFKQPGYTLDGTLILTPEGVKGNGSFEWKDGKLNSKLYDFGAFKTYADTSSVQIKALEGDDIAFDTENVNSDVNFEIQMGVFKANVDSVTTRLPLNKYVTSMNEFVWDMAQETITFISEPGKKGTFTSTDVDQDSLNYEGLTGFYDLRNNQLDVGGVDFILSADALIYPDSGLVKVKQGGEMIQLNNAKIIANTENKYHVINRATVNVKGRKVYKANGFYEYNIGDRNQEIEFTNILGQPVGKGKRSEKKLVTRAIGEIAEERDFRIAEKIGFQGNIGLNAESKNLLFKGFAQMRSEKLPENYWFSIDCEADKNDLLIPFQEPKNFNGDPLRTGLYLSKEANIVYPSVMAPLYYRKDRPILETKGFLKHDREKDTFIFGDSAKVSNLSYRGNILKYNDKTGDINANGQFNLGSGLPDLFKIFAAGEIATNIETFTDTLTNPLDMKVKMDAMTGILFEIPDKLKKIMLADFVNSTFGASSAVDHSTNNFYETAIAEFIPDEKEYTKVISRMKGGALDLPKKYNDYLFLFGKLPMQWDFDYQSFVSSKERNLILSIDGKPVHRDLITYVEFKMPANNDDRLYILIKAPNDYYYFFGYKNGILNTVSNNTRYNDEVVGLKDKERIVKNKEFQFEVQPVNPGTATNFINRIKATHN